MPSPIPADGWSKRFQTCPCSTPTFTVPRTLKSDAGAEAYRAVEIPKGELGIYIRADGSNSPARFKIRSPCFHNLSALPEMAEGEYVADLIASPGSLDIVLGSVDR